MRIISRLPAALARSVRGAWRAIAITLALTATPAVLFFGLPLLEGQGDCADAYIRTVQVKNEETLRGLYRCVAEELRPTDDEDLFVSVLGSTPLRVVAQDVRRVGSVRGRDGSWVVVFTALLGGVQPTSYAIYLDPSGRIVNIE